MTLRILDGSRGFLLAVWWSTVAPGNPSDYVLCAVSMAAFLVVSLSVDR